MVSGFTDLYYFNNTELQSCHTESPNIESNQWVYEVIKIIAGIPLFFEDHYQRLSNSLKLANINVQPETYEVVFEQIKNLCLANNKYFGNMELRIAAKNRNLISQLGFILHHYPEPLNYLYGVMVGTFIGERQNPNVKIKNTQTRLRANEFLNKHPVYEVLLLNKNGQITEGSRSNVFFIKGDVVFTAPSIAVLNGITRKYVVNAIQSLTFTLEEKFVPFDALINFDAAFLCGTSPGVLPIKQINEIEFDVSNLVLRNIIKKFNDLVQNYLSAKS